MGNICETNIDDCLDDGNQHKCLNGGMCIDGIHKFSCNCSGTGKTWFYYDFIMIFLNVY